MKVEREFVVAVRRRVARVHLTQLHPNRQNDGVGAVRRGDENSTRNLSCAAHRHYVDDMRCKLEEGFEVAQGDSIAVHGEAL